MNRRTISIFRKTHGLTQVELAELMGTNVSNISAYERGHTNIPKWFKVRFEQLVEEHGIDWNKEIPDKAPLIVSKKVREEVKATSNQLPLELLEDALNDVQQETKVGEVKVLEKMSDNRPASEHYHTGKIDIWAFADENYHLLERIGFHRVSALKYIGRFGKKDGYNQIDLDKAIVELQKLKELTKGITRQEEIV